MHSPTGRSGGGGGAVHHVRDHLRPRLRHRRPQTGCASPDRHQQKRGRRQSRCTCCRRDNGDKPQRLACKSRRPTPSHRTTAAPPATAAATATPSRHRQRQQWPAAAATGGGVHHWLWLVLFAHGLCITMSVAGVAAEVTADPTFSAPIQNVTAPVGRDAVLTCVVEDLGSFKVAWLRVGTQTILTIQNHVITKNHRVGITFSERKTWQLRLKDIRESDRGYYMCQINTDPMKSQMGYLDVVVPPDILDYPTSTDMVVAEASNVTLKCAATGSPTPTITWRREHGEPIAQIEGADVMSMEGSTITIPRVNRLQMGAYLCIASNGVPPTVSKRVMLIVHFSPMIWVQNQLVGAYEGQRVTLECQSEAYPKSINYWTREKGEIVPKAGKFEPVQVETAYKVIMKLHIRSVGPADFGSYRCVAKNSLGETDGNIKLYRIPDTNIIESADKQRARGKAHKGGSNDESNDIFEEDAENFSNRKDLFAGGHLNENYELSSDSRPLEASCSSVVGWILPISMTAWRQLVAV